MTASTELATVDTPAALSMAGGPDPAAAMDYAQGLAKQLTRILAGATTKIQGKEHVNIEGWQSLAAATGHTCEVEWSRPMPDIEPVNGVNAWEARAVVRDQHGHLVASGESMADPHESGPWRKNQYSVRGMAQTRAMSRALASRMRYVVRMGGMSGTPAEEMPTGADEGPDPKAVARERYKALRAVPGMDEDALRAEMPKDPTALADDGFLVRFAYALGAASVAPVEGEVVEETPEEEAA